MLKERATSLLQRLVDTLDFSRRSWHGIMPWQVLRTTGKFSHFLQTVNHLLTIPPATPSSSSPWHTSHGPKRAVSKEPPSPRPSVRQSKRLQPISRLFAFEI